MSPAIFSKKSRGHENHTWPFCNLSEGHLRATPTWEITMEEQD